MRLPPLCVLKSGEVTTMKIETMGRTSRTERLSEAKPSPIPLGLDQSLSAAPFSAMAPLDTYWPILS